MSPAYSWADAAQYMKTLHALKQWVNQELDRAQLMDPLEPLPQAWSDIEQQRAGLVG